MTIQFCICAASPLLDFSALFRQFRVWKSKKIADKTFRWYSLVQWRWWCWWCVTIESRCRMLWTIFAHLLCCSAQINVRMKILRHSEAVHWTRALSNVQHAACHIPAFNKWQPMPHSITNRSSLPARVASIPNYYLFFVRGLHAGIW